jgi:hypothetical protein
VVVVVMRLLHPCVFMWRGEKVLKVPMRWPGPPRLSGRVVEVVATWPALDTGFERWRW